MYKYIAKAKDGQVVKGELDAQSRDKALALVSAMGLYPVSVNEGKKSLLSMPKKVGKKQISITLRQMSSMINASIPIPVVLSVLRDDEKNPTLKEMLTHIHKDVTDGKKLDELMPWSEKYKVWEQGKLADNKAFSLQSNAKPYYRPDKEIVLNKALSATEQSA